MNQYREKFIIALKKGSLEDLRKIPKSDLHNHFILGGNRKYIQEKTGFEVPLLTKKLMSMDDIHKCVDGLKTMC